jgi:hypothetical protein
LRSARLAAVVAAAALVARPASAQARPTVQSLTATELSAAAFAALSARDFFGLAGGVSRRLDSQTRVAALAAAGSLEGGGAFRLEGTFQLIVNPSGRGGAGLYAGTGVAWQGGRGTAGRGWITALLGLEGAPGARRGWFAEVGLGGGVRLVLGLRWRRFPPWWR